LTPSPGIFAQASAKTKIGKIDTNLRSSANPLGFSDLGFPPLADPIQLEPLETKDMQKINHPAEAARQPHIGQLPEEVFVRITSILAPHGPIPIGRSTWWAGVKTGRFPKPVKLGARTTAWKVQDIRNLIETAS
jgi:prophage regulatory protein